MESVNFVNINMNNTIKQISKYVTWFILLFLGIIEADFSNQFLRISTCV